MTTIGVKVTGVSSIFCMDSRRHFSETGHHRFLEDIHVKFIEACWEGWDMLECLFSLALLWLDGQNLLRSKAPLFIQSASPSLSA